MCLFSIQLPAFPFHFNYSQCKSIYYDVLHTANVRKSIAIRIFNSIKVLLRLHSKSFCRNARKVTPLNAQSTSKRNGQA